MKYYIPANAGSHLLSTVCMLKNLTFTLSTISSSTYFKMRLLQWIVILLMTFVTILFMYPGGASSLKKKLVLLYFSISVNEYQVLWSYLIIKNITYCTISFLFCNVTVLDSVVLSSFNFKIHSVKKHNILYV